MTFLSRRHLIGTGIGLFLTLSIPILATAQNLSGEWSGWMETDDFLGAVRLQIAPAGSTVSLFYAGDKRSGAIDDLKIDGADISFEGKLQPSGIFKGRLSGEVIAGTVDILNRAGAVAGHGSWSARRLSSTVASPSPAPSNLSEIGLAKPSGTFPIGRRLFFWTDESRGEELTDDPNDHRRVFVQLWYPAVKAAGLRTAPYLPAEVVAADPTMSVVGVQTHAFMDAPLAKGRFPLIVFSPGLGTSPLMYASIIEDLVSHGYVVAAMNHPHDSGPVMWPDGTNIRQSKEWDREVSKDWSADERKRFMERRRLGWAQDASFVVDQVKKLDIAEHIDIDRLGMLGHSFGGQAASIVCAADARFKACANLDGLAQGNAVLPGADGKMMTQPFLFFTKVAAVTDAELQMMGMTRSEYVERERRRLTERWKPNFKQQISGLHSGGYLIVYPGITHMTFSDGPLVDRHSSEQLEIRLGRVMLINRYVLAFFDHVLRGTRSTILNSKRPPSPLLVEFLKK